MSVAYGFVWASILYREVVQKKQESKSILETVFLFLGNEEKSIIEFLVQKKGSTTQADISRLAGMTRLKAFRALQKMQNKNLVEIVPHGKIRIVKLKQNILNVAVFWYVFIKLIIRFAIYSHSQVSIWAIAKILYTLAVEPLAPGIFKEVS